MVAVPRLNPVIVKELRSRMRGWRAIATLTFYLAILGGFGLLSIYVASQEVWLANNALLGRSLLSGVVMVELFLVCFITPAFTSGVIAGERERQTHDLLLTTLLASRSIVLGKLISALAYVLLLIVAALPIQGLAFLMGGVAPDELAIVFALVLVTALGIGSLSLLFSSAVRTVLPATVLSYVAVLAIVVGTFIGYYFAGAITRSMPPDWIAYPNPFTAVSSVLQSPGSSPLILPIPAPMPATIMAERTMISSAEPPPGLAIKQVLPQPEPRPIWQYYISLYLSISALAILASALLVKPTHPLLARLKLRR